MKISLAVLLLGFSLTCLRAADLRVGFESEEGYEATAAVAVEGWSVAGEGRLVVSTADKSAGSQSLRLEAAGGPGACGFVSPKVPAEGVRFIDLWIKPAGSPKETAGVALALWGASLGFVAEDGSLLVAPVNGEEEIELIESGIPCGTEGVVNEWMRLTVRQDLKAGTWDLFVNGKMTNFDLALDEEGRSELKVFADEAAPVGIDELFAGAENPLFPDGDRDGMPDAEEIAAGLYPQGDDRKGDLDRDGISNVAEMAGGSSPGVHDGIAEDDRMSLIYVDNLSGNDANDGKRSHQAGGSGPKASIKAAMEAAKDGDTIVVMKGRGVYDEGSRGGKGKRLTIKPVSQIIIK